MHITIIGLGLIGGSIGLALKKAHWNNARIVGYSRSPDSASTALEMGAIDKACSTLEEGVQNADIVIIATPVLVIKEIFQKITYRWYIILVTKTSYPFSNLLHFNESTYFKLHFYTIHTFKFLFSVVLPMDRKTKYTSIVTCPYCNSKEEHKLFENT